MGLLRHHHRPMFRVITGNKQGFSELPKPAISRPPNYHNQHADPWKALFTVYVTVMTMVGSAVTVVGLSRWFWSFIAR